MDVTRFLKGCVFYPCSGLHGTPIKFLGKRFRRFLYADYEVDRQRFDEAIHGLGFKGYRLRTTEELGPENVFGMSWEDFARRNAETISRVSYEWRDPYLTLCRFKRDSDFDDSHGPPGFELMFACAEAIATFKAAFSQRNITPKCLVHVRSGIGCGGNFNDYPKELRIALLENKAGLPPFVLYDSFGSSSYYGDYLDLIEKYGPIERWGYADGGFLELAKLSARSRSGRPA
jgi:hypothetical protein